MTGDETALTGRVAARSAFVGGGVALRNGTTICGVTFPSGRRSPGVEEPSRNSVGVCSRGAGLDVPGVEAAALGAGTGVMAVCARADSAEAANASALNRGGQRNMGSPSCARRRSY